MVTSVDKMWVAGVVSFICQYVLSQFFGIELDATAQAAIVSLITAVATYLIPNKGAVDQAQPVQPVLLVSPTEPAPKPSRKPARKPATRTSKRLTK